MRGRGTCTSVTGLAASERATARAPRTPHARRRTGRTHRALVLGVLSQRVLVKVQHLQQRARGRAATRRGSVSGMRVHFVALRSDAQFQRALRSVATAAGVGAAESVHHSDSASSGPCAPRPPPPLGCGPPPPRPAARRSRRPFRSRSGDCVVAALAVHGAGTYAIVGYDAKCKRSCCSSRTKVAA
jgi:hypothetical protein